VLDLLEEFRGLVEALEAAGVEFAVCGGLAVAIHARPRATLDVDLLLPVDQVDEARERVAWAHGTLPVVSRAGLVAMKRLRGSGQDLDDIRSLEEHDETD
jgi:hypothetical protein